MPDTSREEIAARGEEIFGKMRQVVESRVQSGDHTLSVARVLQEAGLDLDEDDLDRMRIPSTVIAHPFLDWSQWWPWQALWGAWVAKEYPDHALFTPGGIGQDTRLGGSVLVAHEAAVNAAVRHELAGRGSAILTGEMK